jgi:hypothetical protein
LRDRGASISGDVSRALAGALDEPIVKKSAPHLLRIDHCHWLNACARSIACPNSGASWLIHRAQNAAMAQPVHPHNRFKYLWLLSARAAGTQSTLQLQMSEFDRCCGREIWETIERSVFETQISA